MKAYIAHKFYDDARNREELESISNSLKECGIEARIMARDYEKWGEVKLSPEKLMEISFEWIDDCDLLILSFLERGVGSLIETGYACAKGKPIFVITKEDIEIPVTLSGIAKEIIIYDNPQEVGKKIIYMNKK